MLYEYLEMYMYFVVSLLLSTVMIVVSMLLVQRGNEVEKVSTYECGFHPFQDTRIKFDVKFYLVSILFMIFDLEIMFLFPWALVVNSMGVLGMASMYAFLMMLLVGFYYEWKKGGLDWE